ncbi:MAG: DNA polymerase I [bacterium]
MNAEKRPNLYLIDGSALFYRAYFAFIRNPLINSKGEDTSATFGFVNSLLKIIKDEKPEYIAVVFDTKQPTFRHKMYDEYKSTRAKMPDELVAQLPRIHQACEALNLICYELEGYEADDIIGTFATKAEAAGLDVWCVTGDKDYFQLVTDHIRVYTPGKASDGPAKIGREEVKKKFGVYPELVIDRLALMGDSSDNVPGIPGVGPKTADKLLDQFGSLEGVLSRGSEITAKGLRQKVTSNVELARLSHKLVTIETEVPLAFELDQFERRPIDREKTKALFSELEFRGLLKEVLTENGADQELPHKPSAAAAYHGVTDLADLKRLVKSLLKRKEIAVDTETTSLNPLEAELVGVSLAAKAGEAYYIPLGHHPDEKHNLPFDESVAVLKQLLESDDVYKTGQNIKYDLHVLRRCGIEIAPISFDTMLASYVIDPGSREHSLSAQAMKHFDYRMQPITELIGSGKKQKSFATVPVDQAVFYAAEDADYTYRLKDRLTPLIAERELQHLYYDIELPLIKILADMEQAGIRVDADFLGELSIEMDKSLAQLQGEIYAGAGGEFNINSTQQLSHILFDKMALPTKGKTAKKTGYSTDQKVLEELAAIHPFPRLIVDYRQFAKLKSTYVDALPRLVNHRTGRMHTSFNQTITATGRLSSTDPNLQNIPIRTDEGRRIRRAFVARDQDHVLLVADYSQVELRILAHYSEDPALIKAFTDGEDIHSRTAAEVYGKAISEVTSQERRAAKTANFAVIYGVSAFGLAQQTELDLSGARSFIDTYFERYPGIKLYMERTKAQARRDGYVTTLLNRRRYLPEINSKNFNVRQFAERTAINTPIQGTAADMIKLAMISIHKGMAGMKSKMVLQVHDELVFDAHRTEVEKLKKLVVTDMQTALPLRVPIIADVGVGENWLEAK